MLRGISGRTAEDVLLTCQRDAPPLEGESIGEHGPRQRLTMDRCLLREELEGLQPHLAVSDIGGYEVDDRPAATSCQGAFSFRRPSLTPG